MTKMRGWPPEPRKIERATRTGDHPATKDRAPPSNQGPGSGERGERPGGGGRSGGFVGAELDLDRGCVPDLGGAFADGAVAGELADLGDLDDRLLVPRGAVEEGLADPLLAVSVRVEVGEDHVRIVVDERRNQRAEQVGLVRAEEARRDEVDDLLQSHVLLVDGAFARRGLFREADASNEAPSYSAGEAMTLAGMQRGTLETAKDTGERAEHELAEPPPLGFAGAMNAWILANNRRRLRFLG